MRSNIVSYGIDACRVIAGLGPKISNVESDGCVRTIPASERDPVCPVCGYTDVVRFGIPVIRQRCRCYLCGTTFLVGQSGQAYAMPDEPVSDGRARL